ncbi:hypothetical protein D083_0392 [Dickeya solani RNS 08.23.3.1.A]|nr:hypothetical protein D083_0392 [Dickeya solani RNS 08.23.3.1.A]
MTAEWYATAAGSRPPRNFFAAAPITRGTAAALFLLSKQRAFAVLTHARFP